MSILTKIQTWLRAIIREEVSRVDTSLQRERETLKAQLRVFDAHLTTFNGALDRILASSYFVENAQLREHIKELNGHFADVRSTIERLHPTT